MSVNIANNTYNGLLEEGVSSLIMMGSSDMGLFHVKTTNGSKARFSYISTEMEVQELNGICSFENQGSQSLDFLNVTLKEYGSQARMCKSELYNTDYGSALGSYLGQEIDGTLLNGWVGQSISKFSTEMERNRWSADTLLTGTTSGSTMNLSDGIIAQIKAKNAYNSNSNPTGYHQVASTAITSSNAVSRIKAVIDALPMDIKVHPNFKILVSPHVANALSSEIMLSVGVNNIPQLSYNQESGLLTDNFFGYKVFMVKGLQAKEAPANNNIILAGIFTDGAEGVIKLAINNPSDEKNIELKDVSDGDYTRLRIATGFGVSVIPDLSQLAMNA